MFFIIEEIITDLIVIEIFGIISIGHKKINKLHRSE